jgi:hypothetical protein
MGYTVHFDEARATIREKDTTKVMIRGYRQGGVYVYHQDETSTALVATKTSTKLLELAHRRTPNASKLSINQSIETPLNRTCIRQTTPWVLL